MQRETSIAAKIAVLASAVMLTGCAFVPDTVHPVYRQTTSVGKIQTASDIRVYIVTKNEKKHKTEISVEKDGYDIPMAGVYMKVDKDFRSALEQALADRGFKIDRRTGIEFVAIVKHFFSHETNGFSGITQNGNATVQVIIKNKSEQYLSTDISVRNVELKTGVINFSTLAYRSKIAKLLLNKIVNKIVTDPQVIDALFKAAGMTPPALGATVPASVAAR